MTITWSDVLDQFEHRLAAYRDVLERYTEPIGGDWPPPELGNEQLPVELVPRARRLLGQAGELETLIKIRQDALRSRATHGPRHRPFQGRPSRSTDL